jgi:hypothetical protein
VAHPAFAVGDIRHHGSGVGRRAIWGWLVALAVVAIARYSTSNYRGRMDQASAGTMNRVTAQTMIRLSGLAGIVGALFWIMGDALIIGAHASASDYPLLLKAYASHIHFDALDRMLPSSERRLAAGALVADVGIVFYLAGSWHIYAGLRRAGMWSAWPVFALLIAGNAWSPLGHAGFYYVGMVYKTILATPPDAHAALLVLADQFRQVLTFAWILPIATLGLALLLLSVAVARGKSDYPRWAFLVFNPLSFLTIGAGIPFVLPEPAHTWLAGAGFNIGWLVLYGLSTFLLWNSEERSTIAKEVG